MLLLVFSLTQNQATQAAESASQTVDVNVRAWQAIGIYDAYKELGLTPFTAGQGVRVAVIDSGIGVFPTSGVNKGETLDCFKSDKASANKTTLSEFVNAKVEIARIVGVISNDRAGKSKPAYNAMAIEPHGSHVAGIVACNPGTVVTIHGKIFGTMTGIAPGVTLGSYNVFGEGAAVTINDIGNMVRAAVDDKMNIINMSLGIAFDGDPFGFGTDTGELEKALAYAEEHNVLVVAAAGNDGIDSVIRPANTPTVLSVGAVSGGNNATHTILVKDQSYTAIGGTLGWSDSDITGKPYYTSGKIEDGCSALSKKYRGKIAILQRGFCPFDVKFQVAKEAGAIAVILIDKTGQPADLHLASRDGTDPILSGAMISSISWGKIQKQIEENQDTQITIAKTQMSQVPVGTMLSFSSYTSFGDQRPDLVAPGAGIISSITGTKDLERNIKCGSCFMIADGTSMAAPVVVGIAALIYQKHPTWNVQMIRSALIHTASQSKIKATGGALDPGSRIRGAGLVNALEAVKATIGFMTSSTQMLNSKATVEVINATEKDIWVQITATGVIATSETVKLIPGNSRVELELTSTSKGFGELILTPGVGSVIHQNVYSN